MSRTLISRVLLKILTRGYDFLGEQCLMECRHSLDQGYQDVLDKEQSVAPLIVVPGVVLVHTCTERQLLLDYVLHED